MGCGSGMTSWRRFRDWQEAGVWSELHAVMLDRLEAARRIDWERASVDSSSVSAPLACKKGRGQIAMTIFRDKLSELM